MCLFLFPTLSLPPSLSLQTPHLWQSPVSDRDQEIAGHLWMFAVALRYVAERHSNNHHQLERVVGIMTVYTTHEHVKQCILQIPGTIY